jgi:hypothetical protein
MEQKKEIIIPGNASYTELNSLLTKAISRGADSETILELNRKMMEKHSQGEQEQAKRDKLAAEREEKRDKLEAERKEREAISAKILEETRYKPTRLKIFGRRSTEEEVDKKVPYSDVFDDIELQDIKGAHTGKSRIYTDEGELAAYQALKAAGKTNITYLEVEEENTRLKMNVAGEETETEKIKMEPVLDDTGADGGRLAEPGEGIPEEKKPDDPAPESETVEEDASEEGTLGESDPEIETAEEKEINTEE